MEDNAPAGSSGSSDAAHGRGVFVTTHWSVVRSARAADSAESLQALEKLCRAYWYPLYAFVRRSGRSVADSQDLTQGFFALLLEKGCLEAADPHRGRFRTFLLVALKRFMANDWDRARAAKRGGFAKFIPLDVEFAESRLAADNSSASQPDVWFDRQWALALLANTLKQIEAEYVESGRSALFERLRGSLAGEPDAMPYREIAARLNLSEAAVKMAAHRLRARYREVLKREILQTVGGPGEAEAELRHLFSAFQP